MGGQKISASLKKELVRKIPKQTRARKHDNTVLENNKTLIDSFTKEDYNTYEKFHHKWGTPGRKRQVMLSVIENQGITGPVLDLAKLRVDDLYAHQKILAVIRYRWTNLYEHNKNLTNNDPDRFWEVTATKLLGKGNRDRGIHISAKWEGEDGKQELEDFLKATFKKQKGKCAITGQDLVLQFGDGKPLPNRCSLDRINSNNGYTPQNVWMVAWWVNQMKMDTSLSDFWERINILNEARLKLDK